MIDKLEFGGFLGSVHFSAQDEVFFGKLEGIDDLVSFEGSSVRELKKSFKEAVKDYLELCETTGKDSQKSFKGSFNVRITPEIHQRAFRIAKSEGKSLNQFVKEAIESKLVLKK
jgi:predicted HicB family RNase H-like nuclease